MSVILAHVLTILCGKSSLIMNGVRSGGRVSTNNNCASTATAIWSKLTGGNMSGNCKQRFIFAVQSFMANQVSLFSLKLSI